MAVTTSLPAPPATSKAPVLDALTNSWLSAIDAPPAVEIRSFFNAVTPAIWLASMDTGPARLRTSTVTPLPAGDRVGRRQVAIGRNPEPVGDAGGPDKTVEPAVSVNFAMLPSVRAPTQP